MTAPITSLRFWGRPMLSCSVGFWIAIRELGIVVRIHRGDAATSCHWTIIEGGTTVALKTASGPKAARNAAQKWLERRAETTRNLATKGRAA